MKRLTLEERQDRIAAFGVLELISAPDDAWRDRAREWAREELEAYARAWNAKNGGKSRGRRR